VTNRNDFISLVFTSPDWMADAPCQGLTDLFFVEPRQPGMNAAVEKAKAICAGCPHKLPCLEYAIDNNEDHGIWAGRNRTELQAIRRRRKEMGWTTGRNRRQPRHGTDAGIRHHEHHDEELCRDCQWLVDDRRRRRTSPFETTRDRRERLGRNAS